MEILHIAGNGIKGKSFAHDIEKPIVVFTGRNGAGKTTRLQAVDLALRGPRKDDGRYDAEKASCHVRLKVDESVHPGARAEVLRGLGPKHTLTVQPLSKPGRPVTAAQAELDMLLQLPAVVFDTGAFTGLSADRQKQALLPYARHVDAQAYAGIYPSVVPFDGESGSDYLGRVRAAIGEECKALSQRKLAAERAQVQLADHAGHSARPASRIREDMDKVVAMQRTQAALTNLSMAEMAHNNLLAQMQNRDDCTLQLDKSAAELRAELNAVEARLEQWRQRETLQALLTAARAEKQDKSAALELALENLGKAGGDAAYDADRHAQLMAQHNAHFDAARQYGSLQLEHERRTAELADARIGQVETLALLAVIQASPEPVPSHVADLRDLLLRDGFPSVAALQDRIARCDAAMQVAQSNMHPDANGLLREIEDMERARMSAGIMDALRSTAKAAADEHDKARLRVARQEQELQDLQDLGDDTYFSASQAQRDDLRAQLQFAERAESDAASKGAANREAQEQLAQRKAAMDLAKSALAQAEAVCAVTPEIESPDLPERLAALQRELDDAVRAEGRVEAERTAYQDAEAAKVALAAAKDAEKRAKAAADECLSAAMGDVAAAFAPFCAVLGGTWRLGEQDPLGLERDGVWVPYDSLSESERLVYGIGLVLALSTLGKGLRVVMLDGLDDCDVERRQAIMAEAHRLIKAGKLDNVLGTSWSDAGFDPTIVQVIPV